MNVFTVDVEDWFHVCGAGGPLDRPHWESLPSRVVPTTRRLLDALDRAFRQCAERDEVLLSRPRCERRPIEWRQSLHSHIRQGSDAARQRLLVAHPLQRKTLLRAEYDQSVFARHQEQGAQIRRRWLADALHPVGVAGRRAGIELAPLAKGQGILTLCPRLLAEGRRDRRLVDPSRGHAKAVTSSAHVRNWHEATTPPRCADVNLAAGREWPPSGLRAE